MIKFNKIDDKALHVYACLVISVITGVLCYCYLNTGILVSITNGFVLAIVIGFAKEFIWDKALGKGTFNWWDIFYDFWGALIGALILGGILNTLK